MKANFKIESLDDMVTSIGEMALPGSGIKVSDLPTALPFWFKIGKNEETDMPELQTSKLDEPMVLTISGANEPYEAVAIRLFGHRRIKKPR